MISRMFQGHGAGFMWRCLGRFLLLFLVNSVAGYLWFLYEEKLDSLDDMSATLLILFVFANIVVSAFLSVLEIYAKMGEAVNLFVNRLFGMTKRKRSRREESRVGLASVRHYKMRGRHALALEAVNRIIKDDPEFPDALFLKATILWEGFGNAGAARDLLVKVMKKVEDPEESLHRWAAELHGELGRTGEIKNIGTRRGKDVKSAQKGLPVHKTSRENRDG